MSSKNKIVDKDLKVAILCGGQGLRLKGYFDNLPKSLIPLNGKPLLAHIIEKYVQFGINRFVILVGSNQQLFEKFAQQYSTLAESIEIIQTGENTPTGGRLKIAEKHLNQSPFFLLTYGDGISTIDFKQQIDFHLNHSKCITLTAVHPQLPFGLLQLDEDDTVETFVEKPQLQQRINGGFFVINKSIFNTLSNKSDFEKDVLPDLCIKKEVKAFKHDGFWKNFDTYKDFVEMNSTNV